MAEHPLPVVDADSEPFWEALRQRRLDLQWCGACAAHVFYPRALCPRCGGELVWRTASGRGRVYSFTVSRRPASPAFADRVPYVVALVELEEGVRLMSNLVGVAPDEVEVDLPVEVDFVEVDGFVVHAFRPQGGAAGR